MSMTLIPMAEKPSIAMPTCGHAFPGAAHTAAWTIPATADAARSAVRTYALAQGVVDFGNKRRATGVPAWRPTDC